LPIRRYRGITCRLRCVDPYVGRNLARRRECEGDRAAVLFHGFPQTWYAWHGFIPRLTAAGFRVIAVDYRGAGNSSRPLGGYDKRTMALDIRCVTRSGSAALS
jgi:pimeloyl-ACP methyl ester carboxylesterase